MKASPKRVVAVHGHFYQPPRVDPWLEAVPRQPSAAPYHDWNERIEAECYAPVVAAHILDGDGKTRRVMNCLEHMSFNFGPTLLSWMEVSARETYEAVIAADRVAVARSGHGGALAMPYHHPILPLSTRRDKDTEVRWGIHDFRRRFGRDPEGMWLPETAVDEETLDVLAGEGIRFTIVAPHQLAGLPAGGRPGLYETRSGETITLFPYDGALSHGVAFGESLRDAKTLADALTGASEEPAQLRLVATDGETYGHHRTFGEMALAATLEKLNASDEVAVMNLSRYLALHPAEEEVELVSPSSWSCSHGVGRWREDCGCKLDPSEPTQQEWRTPLREAMTELADGLHRTFEEVGGALFSDPWAARDDFGAVAGAAQPEEVRGWVEARLAEETWGPGKSVPAGRMWTGASASSRWSGTPFGSSRPAPGSSTIWPGWSRGRCSGTQSRALELNGALGGPADSLEAGLLERLADAESNDAEVGDGRRLYEEQVRPLRPRTALVAAAATRGVLLGRRAYEVRKEDGEIEVRHRSTGELETYLVVADEGETGASDAGPVRLRDSGGETFEIDVEGIPL